MSKIHIYYFEDIDFSLFNYIESYSSNLKIVELFLVRYKDEPLLVQTPLLSVHQENLDGSLVINLDTKSLNFFNKLDEHIDKDFSIFENYDNYKHVVKGKTLKIRITDDTFMFDENRKSVEKKEIKKDSDIKIIFEISSVWNNKNKIFGLYLKPVQIKLYKKQDYYTYDPNIIYSSESFDIN